MGAHLLHHGVNLDSELSGGDEDEDVGRLDVLGPVEESLQEREAVRRRLAAAGDCAGHDVAPGERQGNGGRLTKRRGREGSARARGERAGGSQWRRRGRGASMRALAAHESDNWNIVHGLRGDSRRGIHDRKSSLSCVAKQRCAARRGAEQKAGNSPELASGSRTRACCKLCRGLGTGSAQGTFPRHRALRNRRGGPRPPCRPRRRRRRRHRRARNRRPASFSSSCPSSAAPRRPPRRLAAPYESSRPWL